MSWVLPVQQGFPQPHEAAVEFANPTGLIGMTAVNGTATTAIRSDATHAIDPAIAPTMTGLWIFSAGAQFSDGSAASPSIAFASEINTGLYWPAANQLGFAVAGVQRAVLTSAGQLQLPTIGSSAGLKIGLLRALYNNSNAEIIVGDTGVGTSTILLGGGAASLTASNSDVRVHRDFELLTNRIHGTVGIDISGSTGHIICNTLFPQGDVDLVNGAFVGISSSGARLVFYDGLDKMEFYTSGGLKALFDNGLNLGTATGASTGEARASVGFAARVDGSGGGFYAGAASDVQLYRSAADTWRTPDSFTIDGGLNLGAGASAGAGQVFAWTGSTSPQVRITPTTSENVIQFWKDNTASVAWSIGGNAPGGSITDDFIFARFVGSWVERGRMTKDGNFVWNTAALATTATDGFIYIPSCAGTPTGTPTAYTGRVPIVVDTTNHKLYFYSGGAWRDAGP